MIRLLVIACLFGPPARAETALSAEAFDALVTGRTLSFRDGTGEPYGVESYQTGRRVIWSWLDGQCDTGTWHEKDGNICFVYQSDPEPQCWRFFIDGDGLRAEFMNDPGSSVLYEIGDGSAQLVCSDFGV